MDGLKFSRLDDVPLSVLETDSLRIFRRQSPVSVLGPGQRAVIWAQGCTFACSGCLVPESWPQAGGESLAISELAHWVLEQPNIEGITLSGGEPMLQAEALLRLIHQVRQSRDLGIVCYTGYRWEYLQQRGTPAQQALLHHIDLLIDGPYQASCHGDLLWRGSSNQRLMLLTSRYRDSVAQRLATGDRSVGLELGIDLSGAFYFTGVPALKDFRSKLAAQMQNQGITVSGLSNGELSNSGLSSSGLNNSEGS
ncbi:MAG: radical SAM protein [Merismopedia sp. SIO2A8]|nr:radical SAM protein [Symploca sp. SIO2B6]NET51009.1 radical SAM protein [Merismopedia sp. SIO2A8]